MDRRFKSTRHSNSISPSSMSSAPSHSFIPHSFSKYDKPEEVVSPLESFPDMDLGSPTTPQSWENEKSIFTLDPLVWESVRDIEELEVKSQLSKVGINSGQGKRKLSPSSYLQENLDTKFQIEPVMEMNVKVTAPVALKKRFTRRKPPAMSLIPNSVPPTPYA